MLPVISFPKPALSIPCADGKFMVVMTIPLGSSHLGCQTTHWIKIMPRLHWWQSMGVRASMPQVDKTIDLK